MDNVWGMATFTAVELHEIADEYEAQVNDPDSTDDPKWLLKRAEKVCKLAEQKEKSLEHKNHKTVM